MSFEEKSYKAHIELKPEISEEEIQLYQNWFSQDTVDIWRHLRFLSVLLPFLKKDKGANTRFLLMNNNWSGLVMDGSADNVAFIKADHISWRYDLKSREVFVTAENINRLLMEEGFSNNIGLLHIDVDGNDYWIWKAIDCVDPDIVIVEYNSVFGADHLWTVPYNAAFFRTKAHYSNLYYGASLAALHSLAKEKDYELVTCNSNGNNAYFVKKEKLNGIVPKTVAEAFVDAKFAESRNQKGELTYLRGDERLKLLNDKDIFNLASGKVEKI